MNLFKSTTAAAALVAGTFACGPADTAEAGGFSLTINRGPAFGYGGGYQYAGYQYAGYQYGGYQYGGFQSGYGYGSGFGYGRPYHGGYGHGYGGFGATSVYHDTSHYDVYPGRYVPHGNHLDYIPGHGVYHQQGHVDVYGPGHFGHGH